MGAPTHLPIAPPHHSAAKPTLASPPLVVGLQPLALVDHVALVDRALLETVPGEPEGSQRVTPQELEQILGEVNLHTLPVPGELAIRTLAGGSVANTIRGLAGGFGVPCAVIGAYGDDGQGHMFVENMESSGVDVSLMRIKQGPTGQCACLVDAEGNRTMRPCLSDDIRLQANELTAKDFQGAKWIVVNGYGFYGENLLERAVDLAKQEGALVSMDFASFEVVRNFRPHLMKLLESGKIDLCFANEDEARELMRGEPHSSPESSLSFLAKYCRWAVVMLGKNGCMARHEKEVVKVPAVQSTKVIDTTGAGDLFASGFLYGLMSNFCLEDCCKSGCCAGAAVIRALGGEVTADSRAWMYQQMKVRNLVISNPI